MNKPDWKIADEIDAMLDCCPDDSWGELANLMTRALNHIRYLEDNLTERVEKLETSDKELKAELSGIAEQMDDMGGEFFPSAKEMETYPILKAMLIALEGARK